MSSRRSRLIRRAARLAIQGDKDALNALEAFRATYKEVRRAARMSMKKLNRTAGQLQTQAELPLVLPKPLDIFEEPETP